LVDAGSKFAASEILAAGVGRASFDDFALRGLQSGFPQRIFRFGGEHVRPLPHSIKRRPWTLGICLRTSPLVGHQNNRHPSCV